MSDGTILMSAEEIDRALSRIAHQVLEYTGGSREVALVGIHTRGVPLARRLAWKIAQAGEDAPPVGILDINMYRDDLSSAESPIVRRTELPFKVDEKQIVLVDDVLFTGRTIRAALDALIDLGRPRAIRLAVLVDRGSRELPIQPDFCGRTFTVRQEQLVEVRLAEIDGGPDQVLLLLKADLEARAAARRLALSRGPNAKAGPRSPAAAAPVKKTSKAKTGRKTARAKKPTAKVKPTTKPKKKATQATTKAKKKAPTTEQAKKTTAGGRASGRKGGRR
jgi:pyrimidine operon attenuation protein / uracil phosphoribosyltransferase